VSARKAAINPRSRKPYKEPAIKKLTLEEAKKVLEAQSDPTDENTEKLLAEINRRLGVK
jgi:hypothetical protein